MSKSASESRGATNPWVLLALLFTAYIVSAGDRVIISLLVEPIKRDLNITDTQFSLLQGMAFFLLYAVAGVPMGLLVDRVRRVSVIAFGMAIWSVMTIFCGLATTFPMLAAARIGVGIGEATLTPAAHSLIANAIPQNRYALAFGTFALGGIVGTAGALAVGGYVLVAFMSHGPLSVPLLGVLQPWQATFIAAALPGLILAPVFLFVREPQRLAPLKREGIGATALVFYRAHWRAVIPHHIAIAFSMAACVATILWSAPFFTRVHHWPIEQAGLWMGVANLVSGVIGLSVGGLFSDFLAKYGVKGRLLLCAAVMPIAIIAVCAYTLTSNPAIAVIGITVFLSCCLLPYGVGGAALQAISPDSARGVLSAVFLLVSSVPTSLGPTIVALCSDFVFTAESGIRYSLLLFGASAAALAACFFLLAIRPFERAIAEVNAEMRAAAELASA